MLFSYPNVWNTCLLLLHDRGYRLYLQCDSEDELAPLANGTWNAELGAIKLRGDNPIELLGLAAIHEYHRPESDVPYWWRVDGDNLVAQLEAEWRARARSRLDRGTG
jgi:hypothetical protein